MGNSTNPSESVIVFRSLRSRYASAKKRRSKGLTDTADANSMPFASGRDPQPLAQVLRDISSSSGWDANLTQARIISEWGALVGQNVAEHATPVFEGSTLVVYCDTTAWASVLREMRGATLGKLQDSYPSLRVEDIKFRGPDAPSWKKGARSVPGRGPRDTYG